MAKQPEKRQREESKAEELEEDTNNKRQKSYTHILSILEDDEEEEEDPNQDSSDIFKTLQQEISSDPRIAFDLLPTSPSPPPTLSDAKEEDGGGDGDGGEERESVMRHLLQASDDELGIPNRVDFDDEEEDDDNITVGNHFLSMADGLWEFEDEAANYYTIAFSGL